MRRSSGIAILLLFVVVLAVLGGGWYVFFRDLEGPSIELSPALERISSKQTLTVTAADSQSPLKSVLISIRRSGSNRILLEQGFTGDAAKEQTVAFTLAEAALNDGAFELEVQATDASLAGFGQGNTTTRRYALRLDNTPPDTRIKTQPPYVRQGGTSCIIYSVSKEVSLSGVQVGEYFFPGYKQPDGDYLCFFAFPWSMTTDEFQPQLIAVDLAENRGVARVPVYKLERRFRSDEVEITDSFLSAKMPEFEGIIPGELSHLERFIRVNRELRDENARALLETGRQSAPVMLWKEAFLRQAGASRAEFADHRSYTYNQEKLEVESTHLGLDIASTTHNQVQASNSGRVVFAGNLGIYGNLVVVDHGLGLQSLYSHLSEIGVAVNQDVRTGDILGLTGETGIAFGDHLHFGIAVSGLEVTPIEWLDRNWIRDNITQRITDAGGEAPELSQQLETNPRRAASRRR